MHEWMNEWMKEGRKEGRKEGNYWINELMNEGRKERRKEGRKEKGRKIGRKEERNERTNDWTNERLIEWMNEWMKYTFKSWHYYSLFNKQQESEAIKKHLKVFSDKQKFMANGNIAEVTQWFWQLEELLWSACFLHNFYHRTNIVVFCFTCVSCQRPIFICHVLPLASVKVTGWISEKVFLCCNRQVWKLQVDFQVASNLWYPK